jgi:hypothetical protein
MQLSGLLSIALLGLASFASAHDHLSRDNFEERAPKGSYHVRCVSETIANDLNHPDSQSSHFLRSP